MVRAGAARPVPAIRCARSRCARAPVRLSGEPRGLCLAHAAKAGQSRYGVKRVRGDVRSFASAAERVVDGEIALGERAGVYSAVRRQVWYHLDVNNVRIESYVADVVFWDVKENRERVVDAKNGLITGDFARKRRWMKAAHGIEVEVWEPGGKRARKAPR